MLLMTEPRETAERRRAAERWAHLVDCSPKSADIAAKVDPAVRHFTDASGATILENAAGRFKIDRMSGEYFPDV
jgi:hypothetical protein